MNVKCYSKKWKRTVLFVSMQETYKNALSQAYSKNNDNIQWQYVSLNMIHLLLPWTVFTKSQIQSSGGGEPNPYGIN